MSNINALLIDDKLAKGFYIGSWVLNIVIVPIQGCTV